MDAFNIRSLSGPKLRTLKLAVAIIALVCTVLLLWPYTETAQSAMRCIQQSRLSDPEPGTTSPLEIGTVPENSRLTQTTTDWSRFAYLQYVTVPDYLCNSVLIFASLSETDSKADRVLLYPDTWSADVSKSSSVQTKLLATARDKYHVILKPIKVQKKDSADATWAEGYTKLLAWNQTEYDRVLHLDSDANLLQSMDELFLLPPSPMAAARAYWLDPKDRVRSAQLMLVQPSEFEFDRVMKAIDAAGKNEYDMEVINTLYGDSCLILPHRPYNLLTGEYKSEPKSHAKYLGSSEEVWDGKNILKEAKYLHFSDWPVPKPWIQAPEGVLVENQPKCWDKDDSTGKDCSDQEIWRGFYTDFARRRKSICGLSYGQS